MPGPPKTPTKILELRGSPRAKRRKNEPEPERLAEMPRPPAHLNRWGKKFWRETGEQLITVGVLTQADLATFEICAMHFGTVAEVSRQIKKDGVTTVDERGLTRKHPLFTVLNQSSQLYARYMAEFGLSPAQRPKIEVSDIEEDDPGEQYFRRLDAHHRQRK